MHSLALKLVSSLVTTIMSTQESEASPSAETVTETSPLLLRAEVNDASSDNRRWNLYK